MSTQKFPIVVDTSIFLAVIGQSENQPDITSIHDRDLANQGIDPLKVRASLLAALISHDLVIPEVVYRQMESHIASPKLSRNNQSRLKGILEALRGHTTEVIPSRLDLYLQTNAIESLEVWAALHEADLGSTASKSHPVCQLWDHLAQYLPKVRSNTDNLNRKPHIETTEQMTLLDFIQIRHRELELNDQEQPIAPYPLEEPILKILEDFLASLQEGKDHFSNLAPGTLKKAPIHIQAASLEWLAETLAPFLIPEFEITLCTQDQQASILTHNKNFLILRKFFPYLRTIPLLDSILPEFEIPAAPTQQAEYPQSTTKIPAISNTLRKALAETLATTPTPPVDEELALTHAVRLVLHRIEQGEQGLHEPLHRGDYLALTLG